MRGAGYGCSSTLDLRREGGAGVSAELPRAFGPYTLLEKIGSGAAGSAYLALGRDGRAVIVKRLHSALADHPSMSARFRHEAAIAVSVDSPHVVRVLDVGSVNGELYVAMDRVPGVTVARLLTLLSESREDLSIAAVVSLFADGLSGLAALHNAAHPTTREPLGVVHRDVSPKNLMITPELRLVLIDLGLGKSSMRDWATATGVVMGTPGYISPEHVRGDPVDHRADLYSLSVIAFELLTKHVYITRQEPMLMFAQSMEGAYRPPSKLRPEIAPSLDQFFERALSIHPDQRFGSAEEMMVALLMAAGDRARDSRVRPGSFVREVAASERRLEMLIAGAAAVTGRREERTEIWAARDRTSVDLAPDSAAVSITDPGTGQDTVLVAQPAGLSTTFVSDTETFSDSEVPSSITQPSSPRATVLREVHIEADSRSRLRIIGAALGIIVLGSAVLTYRWIGGPVEPIDATPIVVAPVVDPVIELPTPEVKASVAVRPIEPVAVEPEPAEPEEDPPQQKDRPAKIAPSQKAKKAPANPPPIEKPPEPAQPTFDALAREAASLKLAHPELGRELDVLITDATMWRYSEDSARTREARQRLSADLQRLKTRGAKP